MGYFERMMGSEPTRYALTQGFDNIRIEDVVLFPYAAFTGPSDREYGYPEYWGRDIFDRAIPELGIEYMNLFADCAADLWLFFFFVDNVYKEDW